MNILARRDLYHFCISKLDIIYSLLKLDMYSLEKKSFYLG